MDDVRLRQIKDDSEPCRLRNAGGSEMGTCECRSPADCPNPPKHTGMRMVGAMLADRFLAEREGV